MKKRQSLQTQKVQYESQKIVNWEEGFKFYEGIPWRGWALKIFYFFRTVEKCRECTDHFKGCISCLQSNTEYLTIQESEMLCQVYYYCPAWSNGYTNGLGFAQTLCVLGFCLYLVHLTQELNKAERLISSGINNRDVFKRAMKDFEESTLAPGCNGATREFPFL